MRALVFLVLMLAMPFFVDGCKGSNLPLPDGEPQTSIYTGKPGQLLVPMKGGAQAFYVPYIEEIIAPSEVAENAPFTIEILISAQYRSVILLGYADNHKQGVIVSSDCDEPITLSEGTFAISPLPDDAEHDYRISMPVTLLDAHGEGEPIDRFVFDVPALPAGSYVSSIECSSPATRLNGWITSTSRSL